MSDAERPSPPAATKKPVQTTLHGVTREDPYAWLRDDNWQTVMRKPETLREDIRAHLEAENAHTDAVMAPTQALREQLFAEFKGRIKENDSSVPAKDGPYAYFYAYETGAQHPRYCRQAATDAQDYEVLFDGDLESKGTSYFSIGGVSHGPDHAHIAYAIDVKGSEYYTISFRSTKTGENLPDKLENTAGSGVWSDAQTVYYTVLDEQHRPCKVYRHRLGTPQDEDELVYEEQDPGFFLGVGMTENRRHVLIDSHDHTTSEVRILDTRDPNPTLRIVSPRQRDLEYEISEQGDNLVILTNADAKDFRVMTAPIGSPGRDRWQELVPHKPGRLILSVLTFAEYIVRLEREDSLPRIVVRQLRDGEEHEIAFEEEAYSLGLLAGFEYHTSTLRFTYSSMTTPQRTFDYDMGTRQRTLVKEQEVPSGHDPNVYRSKRILAQSHDGQTVPVSILWHKDTPIDGSAPLLLYGYGAYGMSIPASFSTSRLSLVDRGFIYAIAHIRGGKDKGYAWYDEGKLDKKKNTFLDLIAAAEGLCDHKFTRPGAITVHGGSAGGMLVGAVANMRPELFHAMVADVPFVDVLNTMCDGDLPLTPPEWPEWGNPIESAEAYAYIASYSPYDNVEAKPYPHILATAGLTDPRVTYWEPAKWVARLRELSTGDNLLLLKTYMEAGHGGAAGRFEKLHEIALVYGFVLLAHGLCGA